MVKWLLASAVTLMACVHDQLVTCPNDQLCPVGSVCDAIHGGCISPAQATACDGLAEQAACSADVIEGYCFDGVCLRRGCSNRVREPGEMCDDGNLARGDGCSADCSSDERCGNGVRDAGMEGCDDGNLMSHDGCDSSCNVETETWTIEGIAPTAAGSGVYDDARQRLLLVSSFGELVWTWNGTRWQLVASDGPALDTSNVMWNPDRHTIVAIDLLFGGAVWEWDGTTWTTLSGPGPRPALDSMAAAYDVAEHRIIAFGQRDRDNAGPAEAWAFDVPSATWTQLPPPSPAPVFDFGFAMAYDEMRGRAVVVMGAAPGAASNRVYEWSGAWTTVLRPMPIRSDWTVTYDAGVAAVIAVGGSDNTGVPSNLVSKWTGNGWTALPAMPIRRNGAMVVFDRARNRRVVFGGYDASFSRSDVVVEWDGTAWRTPPRLTPPLRSRPALAFDPRRGRVVQLGGEADQGGAGVPTNETWTYDGTWRQLPSGAIPVISEPVIAYDPIRDAMVATGPDQGTWLLVDDRWTALEPAAPGVGRYVTAMTFDPVGRRILAIDPISFATLELPSDGTTWRSVGDATNATSIAFDARNARFVATDGFETTELVDQTWFATLSPGIDYSVVADARHGTVVFRSPIGSVWERTGASWSEHAGAPIVITGVTMYDPRRGEVIVDGEGAGGRLMLRRGHASELPDESCDTLDDRDGDGLAGCDDPDCVFACDPTCPPYTSCP